MIKKMMLAMKQAHCAHGADNLTDVLSGPDTTFRSELIDAMSVQR